MFANAKTLLVIVSCALVAHAQSGRTPTSSTAPASQSSPAGGIPPCVLTCATQAAPVGGCSGPTDIACACSSTAFQQAALGCIQANCSAADAQTALQLEQQQCAALSSGSGSATGSTPASTAHSTGSKTSASASASSSRPATSSGAAMALSAPFSLGGLVGTLFASAGALVGAAFVL